MSRPALSASRSFDIIELLAAFPEKGFTMSDISRATGINIASCHAVLTALTERGYLARSSNHKTYKLGLSLIAVGHGAEKSHPMAVRAMQAADQLAKDLGVAVILCTALGQEIFALYAREDAEGRDAGLHVGERLPLVAPVGAPFLAWAQEDEINEWISRRSEPWDQELHDKLKRDIHIIRERGFQVYFRSAASPTIASLMAQMSTTSHLSDYKGEISRLVNSFDYHVGQPEKIEETANYDVMLISAPIFDRNGEAAFNLGLGGFAQPLTGARLISHADKLMRACLDVMRADRALALKREHTA